MQREMLKMKHPEPLWMFNREQTKIYENKTATDSWYVRCNCRFFELFEKYGGFKNGQLKLKRPKQLQEVLDIVRQLLSTGSFSCDPDLQDKKAKLQQMKLVLEMWVVDWVSADHRWRW